MIQNLTHHSFQFFILLPQIIKRRGLQSSEYFCVHRATSTGGRIFQLIPQRARHADCGLNIVVLNSFCVGGFVIAQFLHQLNSFW